MSRPVAIFSLFAAALAPRAATAQHPPLELTRPGPRPARVSHGEVLTFARTFTATRHAARILAAYIENTPSGGGALRTALFDVTSDAPPALTRAREDALVAPDARAVSLTWDGTRGALAYIVPRVTPPRAPHQPPVRRAPAVGIPPATDDPLGPSSSSGGDVVVQFLDASGAPAGAPRTVFHEHSRLWRVAVAREGERWVVAWTGSVVTDDEVRGTVRAMRLDSAGAPTRAMASSTGFVGDPGNTLAWVRAGEHTRLAITGSSCRARDGERLRSLSLNEDPSAQIEAPERSPQPQAPVREFPSTLIECSPMSLHVTELGRDDTFGPLTRGPWLRADAVSFDGERFVAPVLDASGAATWATATLSAASPPLARFGDGRPVTLAAPPMYRAPDLTNRVRPATNTWPPTVEAPVAPPPVVAADTVGSFLRVPVATAFSSAGSLVAITDDRRGLARVAPGSDAPSLVASAASPFVEVTGAVGDWFFVREGYWSGPVRALFVPSRAAVEAVAFAPAHAVPVPPPAQRPHFPTTRPLVYDAEFSALFARTRIARSLFIRHENLAGMLAARPEAPTDPRMPPILAVRHRLQSRWENLCSPLRSRARTLAREGAGQDVISGVNQLCEIHPELQLGVPVDPSL